MISADVKADAKQQEIKELVAISCNFKVRSKLEWQCKTGMYFSFNFAWYTTNLTLSIKNWWLGFFYLMSKVH